MPDFTLIKARVNAPSTDTEAHNRAFGEHKWISDQVFGLVRPGFSFWWMRGGGEACCYK